MERKLIRQGHDALTATLPAKWLRDKGLKAGSNIYIDIEKNNLILRANPSSSSRDITVDVRGNERSMIWHKILSKYISGYDTITILHNNPEITQQFSKCFLGIIIEEHTNTKTVMKSLIITPESNIENVIRRIVHMFEQEAMLLEGLTTGKALLNDVKIKEELLDMNIYYCMRYINKYHLQLESYKQFLLCATIETAADLVLKIAENIGKNKALALKIRDAVEQYNKLLFTNDLEKMYKSLKAFRNSIQKKTFAEGLTYELAELLYNNIGYIMDKEA